MVTITDYTFPGDADKFTFPRAGEVNASTELKLVEVPTAAGTPPADMAPPPSVRALGQAVRGIYETYEYTARCGWMPNGNAVSRPKGKGGLDSQWQG